MLSNIIFILVILLLAIHLLFKFTLSNQKLLESQSMMIGYLIILPIMILDQIVSGINILNLIVISLFSYNFCGYYQVVKTIKRKNI